MSAIYKCNIPCPVGKRCFICKTNRPVPGDTVFLIKCPHRRHDLAVLAADARSRNSR